MNTALVEHTQKKDFSGIVCSVIQSLSLNSKHYYGLLLVYTQEGEFFFLYHVMQLIYNNQIIKNFVVLWDFTVCLGVETAFNNLMGYLSYL